jgi:FAD synthase
LEVHVLGGDRADLTPRTPIDGVWLEEYLRPEVRFASAAELIAQLAADESETRRLLTSDDRHRESQMNPKTQPERRPKAGA